jgi:bla regulator protein blaR1
MISPLFQATVSVTVLLVGLCLLGRFALRWFSPVGVYRLWALLPLSMLTLVLPQWQLSAKSVTYVVQFKFAAYEFATQSRSYTNELVAVWLTGAMLLGLCLLIGHKRLISSLKLTEHTGYEKPSALRKSLSGIRLAQSDLIGSPLIFGIFRPTLVLPADFEQLFSPQQQQLILQHELCHWRRGDLHWNLLAMLMLCAFWFNPLSWLGLREFYRLQELSCDQTVLSGKGESEQLAYAQALLMSAQNKALTHKFVPQGCLTFGGTHLIKERIMNTKSVSSANAFYLVVGILIMVILSGINMVSAKTDSQQLHPVKRIEPRYPIQAAEQGLEADVVLRFTIDNDGSVSDAEVVSSTHSIFEAESLRAIKQWQYQSGQGRQENVLTQLSFRMDAESVDKAVKGFNRSHEMIAVQK